VSKKLLLLCVFAGLTCSSQKELLAQGSSSDATVVLQNSLAAQSGSVTIQSVLLTGTTERIAGSDDETVSARFEATLSRSSRSDVSLAAGTLTEVRQAGSTGTTGAWSSGDGQYHPLAGHNLLTDGAWWFPEFVTQRLLSDPNAVVTFVGTESGLAHFKAVEAAPTGLPQSAADEITHLSQVDLYLDPTTLLPVQLCFALHPDNNALVDIPVTVQYSAYQAINGATIPMHIQESLNGTLALDIVVQNATFNVAVPQTDFSWQ
jgi:hypothetical protein